jgi:hypothetical protein
MNRMLQIGLCVAAITTPFLVSAAAQAGIVAERSQRQESRIETGVQQGTLTNREAYRLNSRQEAIERSRQRDIQDGQGLTLQEKRNLTQRQNALSQDIYRQKHDAQNRSLY